MMRGAPAVFQSIPYRGDQLNDGLFPDGEIDPDVELLDLPICGWLKPPVQRMFPVMLFEIQTPSSAWKIFIYARGVNFIL